MKLPSLVHRLRQTFFKCFPIDCATCIFYIKCVWELLKPGIHLNMNESTLYLTMPMRHSVVPCDITSTQHYCKYVRPRQLCRIWVFYAELSNAHFDGLTTIGSGRPAFAHFHSVCFRSLALSTPACRGDTVRCGFICAQVYSWHEDILCILIDISIVILWPLAETFT